jgi:DNA polymerase-1
MKILLVDGSNAMWRAALSKSNVHMQTKLGQKTGAIISFVNGLSGHLQRHQASHFAVVFDGPEASFRSLLLPTYKASREHKMEAEIAAQIPFMHIAVKHLGGNLINSQNYEADDIIASLVKFYNKEKIVIISDDKDLGCLVKGNQIVQCRPCDSRPNKPSPILNEEAIIKKWRVKPYVISDVLALCGDNVDELIGVKGIGPVFATQMIAKYGSLEEYALHANEDKSKNWMYRASAMTTVNLLGASTRLITNAPVKELLPRPKDWHIKTVEFLEKLEAFSTIKRIKKIAKIKVGKSKLGKGLFT